MRFIDKKMEAGGQSMDRLNGNLWHAVEGWRSDMRRYQ